MTELVRKIEKEDIPKLRELLDHVFGDDVWETIERLGGMTNHSYKITREDGNEYLVRIPGEGTEDMINRSNERKSTELGCGLGIDSLLLYFDDQGRKIMKFISDSQSMNEETMRRKENILKAVAILRRLHYCGIDTGVRFEVFGMADLYEKIIHDAGVRLYPDYERVKQTLVNIKKEVDKNGEVKKVPCHNDTLPDNWVMDSNGKLYLVDWEYGGMNEATWDLSCLSIETNYSPKNDDELLELYYGRIATIDEKKRFKATKLYVDFLWALWGLARIPYGGQYMRDYADNRYERLKKNIDAYKKRLRRLV